MDQKKISVATVAKRMNRILAAYREQRAQETQSDDGTTPVASTSSSSSQSSSSSKASADSNCSAVRKSVLDKAILKFAAQIDTNESDSNSNNAWSEQSFSFAESPPKRRLLSNNATTADQQQSKRRRSQPSRTVKRAAVKLTPLTINEKPTAKRAQRKVTRTITSSSLSPNQSSSTDSYSDASMLLAFSDSDDSDSGVPVTKQPRKQSKPSKRSKSTKPAKSIKSSIINKTT